jgi:hypothetical protein
LCTGFSLADKYEGLVIVGNLTLRARVRELVLARWESSEQLFKRALAFNPKGVLNGPRRIAIAGTYAYVLCDRGLVVVNIDNPLLPKVTSNWISYLVEPGELPFNSVTFVVDREGFKGVDVTSRSAEGGGSGASGHRRCAQCLSGRTCATT